METFSLGQQQLTSASLHALARKPAPPVEVTLQSRQRLEKYRALVDKALTSGNTVYGINTGFGFLSDVKIEPSKLRELQENLIRSHACGVGPRVEDEVVRALLILRAHTFCLGHSAVTTDCVDVVLKFLEHDIMPVIPSQGSVGASGDLAPLAHLAMGLMGEGDVIVEGRILPASEACENRGITPLKPQAKEGLALINGTHFMTTLAAFAVEEAQLVARSADVIAALSLDAIKGTLRAFDPRIHQVRPHHGQGLVAENFRNLFASHDPIMESHRDCGKVQDPYSFRCIPQVHGAVRDTIEFVSGKINIELNSVTDNPLCFEDGALLSGGNFHGEPMAFAMDYLCIASAEIGSIAERRIEKLTNPAMSGLPAFITADSGLNSGYMIPHVVAAALVSENKILAHPASVDSIPTSADKEDHVSMGPIAARKCRNIIKNVANILAIELLAACQGIDLLKPLKPNNLLESLYNEVRKQAPFMGRDRSLHKEIEHLGAWILRGGLVALMKKQGLTIK